MNKEERKAFVVEYIEQAQTELLEKVSRTPDDWDGWELRRWIADAFNKHTFAMQQTRLKRYQNAVLVNNL